MTENRCIELLKKMKHMFTETCAKIDENTALDMAVEAIEEIQKYRAIGTVEDVEFYKKCYDEESYEYCGEYGTDTCGCKRRMEHLEKKVAEIDAIGTIDEFKALKEKNEPKKSEWKYYRKENIATCKNCSYEHYLGTYHQYATNYCPNCGSKMTET